MAIENFLAFGKAAVDLSPGLNVVLSPNEGGKSSLFRAVVTALFVDSNSRSGEVRALGRWGSGSLFRLELRLRFKDVSLRLERDYQSREQAIYREGEGVPVARGKAVDELLKKLLPLGDRNLFLRVCGVRHEELALVRDGAPIGEKIEEILGGGWGEATPARLKQALGAKRRELVKGMDRPVYDENLGPVRRYMNEVEEAEQTLARATASAMKREELLRSISSFDSDLGRLEETLMLLASRREKAARYAEIERREGAKRREAEELRRRVDRMSTLASRREELLREGERFPEALTSRDREAVEKLRSELEEEALLAREVSAASSGAADEHSVRARPSAIAWLLFAVMLILSGVLGGLFWKMPMLLAALAGLGCLVWRLRGPRGRARGEAISEKRRELEKLAAARSAWSPRDVIGSRELLKEYAKWSEGMREVDSRIEEAAGPSARQDGLVSRLDGAYGSAALEARGLAEELAKLEPFRADAAAMAKLERDLRLAEEERSKVAAARAQKEKELATLECLDVNEVRERLESAKERLRRAERKVEVTELILDALEEAHGEMAGFLAERLPPLASRYVARMTGGRYGELFIDPLSMKIETVPAAGDGAGEPAGQALPDRVSPELLSQGARDQIYLAVRLALVELLSREEPQPLFLDDPFVHFDPARRERAIELVADFSRRHQVVIFTCDPYYRSLGGRTVELAR